MIAVISHMQCFCTLPNTSLCRQSSNTGKFSVWIWRRSQWQPSKRWNCTWYNHAERTKGVSARRVPPKQKPETSGTDNAKVFWLGMASELALGGIGGLLCLFSNESILGSGFSLHFTLLGVALLATAPLCLFSIAMAQMDKRMQELTAAYCKHVFVKRFVWEIALFCLVGALGEEILFRSFLMQLFIHHFGHMQGQVASSILFGLCHGTSASLMLASGVSGFFLCMLFVGSGYSIALPVLVHFLFNFLTILVFRSGLNKFFTSS